MPGPDAALSLRPWHRRVLADSPTVVGALRRELVAYARSLGASDEESDAVALAASEALTNVVRHAYVGLAPGSISVDARLEGSDQLLVLISDEGRGPVPRADSPGLGLGLGVMAQTADYFSISKREGAQGTVVTLRFSLRAPKPNDDSPGGGEPPARQP